MILSSIKSRFLYVVVPERRVVWRPARVSFYTIRTRILLPCEKFRGIFWDVGVALGATMADDVDERGAAVDRQVATGVEPDEGGRS